MKNIFAKIYKKSKFYREKKDLLKVMQMIIEMHNNQL